MYMSVDMKTQADRDGKEEAFDEGKAEGMAQGEKKRAKEIALQLLLDNVPSDIVGHATRLTDEDIKDLLGLK